MVGLVRLTWISSSTKNKTENLLSTCWSRLGFPNERIQPSYFCHKKRISQSTSSTEEVHFWWFLHQLPRAIPQVLKTLVQHHFRLLIISSQLLSLTIRLRLKYLTVFQILATFYNLVISERHNEHNHTTF